MIKAEGPTPPPMRLEDRQWAGLFLFAGTVQFAIGMIIAEALAPTYSVATNYISDLGVRAGAPIFNGSIILLGIAILATSWFVFRAFKERILMIVVLLAGAGAVGVGVFTENAPDGLHSIVTFITFLFAALSAILPCLVHRLAAHVDRPDVGGTPLLALCRRFPTVRDRGLIASMFTAIQSCMDDSFPSRGIGEVRSIETGDRHHVGFGRGQSVLLYVVYRG